MDPQDDSLQGSMNFVVGASNDAVKSVLRKLGNLLAHEYILIRGVRGDIQFITDELASMQAFLNRLKRAHGKHDEQQQEWMKQVREVAYDIEDCVDNGDHHLSREPGGSGKLASFRRAWYLLTTLHARHSIATEIGDLKARAQEIAEQRIRYGVGVEILENDSGKVDESASIVRLAPPPKLSGARTPVGTEDAMKELEPWFAKGKQQSTNHELRCLAIVGFGGVGKTTLAMALSRKFGDEFDCRASVILSPKFDLGEVLKNLVKQIYEQQARASNNYLDDRIEVWGLQELKKKLSFQLKGKRYLILVHDVWSSRAWQDLCRTFPRNEKGGTIVATTRFQAVATSVASNDQDLIYSQELLSEENSCRLFHEIISGAGHDICPIRPINYGIIMKVCGGTPLAINLVAGLIASKLRSEPGSDIDYHLVQLGNDLREDSSNGFYPERMFHILEHCYNQLPADLKTCLLYLSMFPRGSLISRKRMTRIWIAEGFITENEKHGKTIEEVAEDYFNELVGRNLIQGVSSSSSTGKVKNCTIHDMVLEFIVAKSSAEDFITVVGGYWLRPAPGGKVRRLSIQYYISSDKAAIEKLKLSHFVRSLMAYESSIILHSDSHKFQVLQVLDLEGCKDLSFRRLKKICTMRQLKYLSLRSTDIERIPNMIGMLKYLEVLDIRETNVRNLPVSAERLQRMTHLLAGNKNKRIEFTLTEGVPDHLRVLEITWSFDQCNDATSREALLSCIKKQRKIESLIIHCEAGCSMEFLDFLPFPHKEIKEFKVTSGKFVCVPRWIKDLKHLAFLQITVCKLAQNDINMLKELPKLQCLVLDLDFIPREEIVIESEGFHELMRLSIDCPVPWLAFRMGAMPKLTYLQLKFCSGAPSKESVPSGIDNLQRLREVVLCYNQKWCANSSSVKVTIEAVKKEVAKHHNRLDLIINGTTDHVEEVDEESERAIQIQSGHVTPVCEETVRTPADIQGEIEEAEEDHTNYN